MPTRKNGAASAARPIAKRYIPLAEAIAANRRAIEKRGEKPPAVEAIRRQIQRQRAGRDLL